MLVHLIFFLSSNSIREQAVTLRHVVVHQMRLLLLGCSLSRAEGDQKKLTMCMNSCMWDNVYEGGSEGMLIACRGGYMFMHMCVGASMFG